MKTPPTNAVPADVRVPLYRTLPSKTTDPLVPLRKLLWLYFWLLIFEGALRKWPLRAFSAPLLIIRDPVVLLLYYLAIQRKIFPKGSFLDFLKVLSALGALLVLIQFSRADRGHPLTIPVLAFGWRTDFLYFPLIFLIPKIFDEKDVLKMGKWFLIVSIPMALLMAYQFNSSPASWVNRTVGLGEGRQLDSALGKIRPAGTFSFITGPVCFYAASSAFLFLGMANRKTYLPLLLLGAFVSTGLAAAVSGSRSCLIGILLVAVGLVAGLMLAKQLATGAIRLLVIGSLALLILGSSTLFQEGREVFAARWIGAESNEVEGGGLIGRFLHESFGVLPDIGRIPLLGFGLGVGTNVGSQLLNGEVTYLLSEGEWGRDLLEMGPLLGLAFVGFRVALVIWLAKISTQRAKRGKLLSLLLFCAVAVDVFNGQIGQPTTLGFTMLGAGLCLAALGKDDDNSLFNVKRIRFQAGGKRFGGREALRGSLAQPSSRPAKNQNAS